MSIATLKDTIKAIAQSLQLSMIIPALMLVLVNVFLVFPMAWPDSEWGLSNDVVVTSVIFAAIVLSYLLYAFNHILIRMAEGYVCRKLWTHSEAYYRERYYTLQKHTKSYLDTPERRQAFQELDTRFPSKEDYILPTALGNVIASFEHYPSTRYGIDGVAIWPRLVPILQKKKYSEFVSQQKAIFDFMLNMMYVAFICGMELVFSYSATGQLGCALVCIVVVLILVALFYLGAMNGALLWGLSVRVAFDLYRRDLWKWLHLKPVSKFEQERERWKAVSRLIKGRQDPKIFKQFSYKE